MTIRSFILLSLLIPKIITGQDQPNVAKLRQPSKGVTFFISCFKMDANQGENFHTVPLYLKDNSDLKKTLEKNLISEDHKPINCTIKSFDTEKINACVSNSTPKVGEYNFMLEGVIMHMGSNFYKVNFTLKTKYSICIMIPEFRHDPTRHGPRVLSRLTPQVLSAGIAQHLVENLKVRGVQDFLIKHQNEK